MSSSAAVSFSAGLEEPNWNAPLAVDAYLQGAAADGTVKGMFFTCVTKLARQKSGNAIGRDSYMAFKNYPMREWLELLPECARAAYPRLPVRAALYETGLHIYHAFSESTVGRVVMSVAGRDVHAAIRLTARAYEVAGSKSKSSNTRNGERSSNCATCGSTPIVTTPGCLQAAYRPLAKGLWCACGR